MRERNKKSVIPQDSPLANIQRSGGPHGVVGMQLLESAAVPHFDLPVRAGCD